MSANKRETRVKCILSEVDESDFTAESGKQLRDMNGNQQSP